MINIMMVIFAVCCLFSATASAASKSTVLVDGLYAISPMNAPSYCLDVPGGSTKNNAELQIYSSNNTDSQMFYVTNIGNSFYVLEAKVSGKVVDVKGGSKKSGTKAIQYDYKNGNNQKWLITPAGNGYYYIKPYNNLNLCLDVKGGGTSNGTKVQVYTSNGTSAQKWKFRSITTNSKYSYNGSIISSMVCISSSKVTFSIAASGRADSKIVISNLQQTISDPYNVAKGEVVITVSDSSGNIISQGLYKGKTIKIPIKKKYRNYTVTIARHNYKNKTWAQHVQITDIENGCITSQSGWWNSR